MSMVREPDEPPSQAPQAAPSPGVGSGGIGGGATTSSHHVPAPPIHLWRSKNPLDSFQHAIEGVVHTFRTQRNMRFHFVTVVLVLLSGILFRLPATEMLVLLLTASLVLLAEMFNTAIEAVVDMITQSYHPAAKFAKDVSAGAVLVASINAVVVGCIVFLGGGRPQAVRLRLQDPPTLAVFFAGIALLCVCLLLGKAIGRKGTLLRGGVVSGHAAVAFFLATTIVFVTSNLFVAILAVLLAFLVAQARLEARIHTVQEVVIGAALAFFLTASIYRIPVWVWNALPGATPGATQPSPR